MKVIYDKRSDIVYIKVQETEASSDYDVNEHTKVLLDKKGRLVAIEVSEASKCLPKSFKTIKIETIAGKS